MAATDTTADAAAASAATATPAKKRYAGQVKWFGSSSDAQTDPTRRKPYGFVTIVDDCDLKDVDVFVHQSAIRPCKSTFRTLCRGEFVHFELVQDGADGRMHAINVTGINGYPIMCDIPLLGRQNRRHFLGEDGEVQP